MTEAFNMDCMEAMAQMKDNEYDLAIVDPPYGIDIANQTMGLGGGFTKHKKTKDYKTGGDWDKSPPPPEYFTELFRVSSNQIIWGGNYFDLSPTPCYLFWDKKNGGSDFADGELAWTSFKSPIRRFSFLWAGCMRDKNNYGKEVRIHPTHKPIDLYRWTLKNYAKEGDRILDTHLGSGSSRIAAHDMGFDFVGYEIDKDYFDAQEKRFANHIQQQSLFTPKDMYT